MKLVAGLRGCQPQLTERPNFCAKITDNLIEMSRGGPISSAMPSLRQLHYLVELHDSGHFRLAAERSGVSQPTLSAQIQALERRLGVQLVERQRTPVLLTPAGQAILPLAREVIATVKRVHETARIYAGGAGGVVRIGVPVSISPCLLPNFLPVLQGQFPALRLYVREAIPAMLLEGLNSGSHDLLLAPLPVRGGDFECLPLFREPLLLAVPACHALAAKDAALPSDLKEQSILALEKGHFLMEQVESICSENGARMLHDYEGTSLGTLQQMVATGVGLTVLPAIYVRTAQPMPGIKLLHLKGKPLQRTIGLAWRSGSPLAQTYRCVGEQLALHVRQRFPDFALLLPKAAA